MKIAIIGGGPAGLCTYLNLKKTLLSKQPGKNVEIVIYETHDPEFASHGSHSNAPTSGGGYGLAPTGMKSLKRLDPHLHDQIFKRGFPTSKTLMKSATGWTLGSIPFNDLTGKDPECCVMVLRETVLDVLSESIPAEVFVKRKVVEVEDSQAGATVTLEGGEKLEHDLVIGADGIWSKVRRAISGEKHGPEYKGLFTVGGFVSSDCLPKPSEFGVGAYSQTCMTFGTNSFFGYTPYTTGDTVATDKHIRGEATLPAGDMAFWWSRSEQKDPGANPDDEAVKRELQKRHASWQDPAIHKIIQETEVPLKIPTYVLPKQPTWAGKRVVLVGDAAHALPSSSGQGISQCFEDAEALSLLLAHHLINTDGQAAVSEALQKTFDQYMNIRKAHVEKILDIGNKFGEMSKEANVVVERLTYVMLWCVFRLMKSPFMKVLQEYDVVAEVEKVLKQHQS